MIYSGETSLSIPIQSFMKKYKFVAFFQLIPQTNKYQSFHLLWLSASLGNIPKKKPSTRLHLAYENRNWSRNWLLRIEFLPIPTMINAEAAIHGYITNLFNNASTIFGVQCVCLYRTSNTPDRIQLSFFVIIQLKIYPQCTCYLQHENRTLFLEDIEPTNLV